MRARELRVAPISAADARRIVTAHHYSGKAVQNSSLHLGVFSPDGRCGGAMSFGASIDKRRMMGLVRGTKLNEFLELNRMAFADWLPRNSESRCLGVALRLIRRSYPRIKWVVSFADATQCGDGTIYRASGFVLTQIKKNTTLLRMPDGSVVAAKTLDDHIDSRGRFGSAVAKEHGAKPLVGFQLRYIYFTRPEERGNLTVPELPFSAIREAGASMYRARAVQ